MTGPTSAQLLRAGTPAEEIRCVGCDGAWDGTTLNALPACATCREIAALAVRAWVRMVLATPLPTQTHDEASTAA